MENNALEFKKLSEVETAETVNEVDTVLIVQNGEIKQTPKNNLGGAGGSGGADEYDLVLQAYEANTLYIMSGSVQAVIDKLNNKKFPHIYIYGNADKDYCISVNAIDRAPTYPDFEYIGFGTYTIPGSLTLTFGIETHDDTHQAYVETESGSKAWAVEYNG